MDTVHTINYSILLGVNLYLAYGLYQSSKKKRELLLSYIQASEDLMHANQALKELQDEYDTIVRYTSTDPFIRAASELRKEKLKMGLNPEVIQMGCSRYFNLSEPFHEITKKNDNVGYIFGMKVVLDPELEKDEIKLVCKEEDE